MSIPEVKDSLWSPLKSKAFLILFIATVVSNIGTWMQEVGASWLMVQLTTDPTMVALIQTFVTLPIFMFALPAGAFADLLNRRRLLIVVNLCAAAIAWGLALVVHFELITPYLLLLFTFMLGSCAAFTAPAWQAIVPSLVEKQQLSSAVSLNGVGINISRAIGPALAGTLIVYFGLKSPFILNGLSFFVIIGALFWWNSQEDEKSTLPKEHLLQALISGLRFAKHSKPLKHTLTRVFAFFSAASAFWAMLPLIVNRSLNGEASLFGIATGLVGLGALLGAFLLPKLKQRFSPTHLLTLVSVLISLILLSFTVVLTKATLMICCLLFGLAWIVSMSSLNLSAQTSLPDWVRARGLSVFLTVSFGTMSLGSFIWGNVAANFTIEQTLFIAGVVMLLNLMLTYRFELNLGNAEDLEPSLHWAAPVVDPNPLNTYNDMDRGPVLITIEYKVKSEEQPAFIEAISALGESRKRYGAYAWGVMKDSENHQIYLEYFFETSWAQHLRHHDRTSGEDKRRQNIVNQYHCGESNPKVKHLLAI